MTDTLTKAENLLLEAGALLQRAHETDGSLGRAMALFFIGGQVVDLAAELRALRAEGKDGATA